MANEACLKATDGNILRKAEGQLDNVSLGPDTAADRSRPAGSNRKMSNPYKLDRRSGASDDSKSESRHDSEDRRQGYTDRRHHRDRRSNGEADEHKGTYRGRGNGQGRRYPDRWANYDPIGKEMTGTRFVAFKCPLDESYFHKDVHPDEFFDIHTLVGYARDAQRRLGMVIDLTNTTKYYDSRIWYDYDVEYKKLFCPGHEVNGRDDLVEKFNSYVDEFIEKNKDNDKLIGVHCTHGLNRTGYMMCRYVIDRMNWTADEAIKVFEECRGHGIERDQYKKTLREAQRRRDQARNGKSEEDTKVVTDSTAPPSDAVPPPPRFDDDDASEAPPASSLPPPPTF
ncbi:pir-1 [Pristionchus pacificus]|nr:pir-1 [Pristionchus pacificus]